MSDVTTLTMYPTGTLHQNNYMCFLLDYQIAWSGARVGGKAYSPPSRLIGRRLEVRLRAAQLQFRLDGELVRACERIMGRQLWKVD